MSQYEHDKIVPFSDSNQGKKEQVAQMFDTISENYDGLNKIISLGTDATWKKKILQMVKLQHPTSILDIATGTGDFAIEALALKPEKIVGVDISEGMLNVGKEKVKKLGVDNIIEMQLGDSERLLFEDNTFDAVIVSFGVRNFENLEKGLTDMCRVMKPGGTCIVLEFSKPKSFPFKQIYNFYFKYILPTIGNMVSKDSSAYTYLPESVQAFPDGEDFLKVYHKAGFTQTQCLPLTFGISTIYIGKK